MLYLLGSAVACFGLVPFHCSDLYRWSESASCFFCLAGLRFSFAGGLSHFFGFTVMIFIPSIISFCSRFTPRSTTLLFCYSKLSTLPLYCCSLFEYSKSAKKKFLDLVSGIPACSPATVDDNEFWLPTFSEAPRCAFLSAASLLRVLF